MGHLGSLPRLVEDRVGGENPIVSRGATFETGGTTSTSQSSNLCVWNARSEVDAPDTSQLDMHKRNIRTIATFVFQGYVTFVQSKL